MSENEEHETDSDASISEEENGQSKGAKDLGENKDSEWKIDKDLRDILQSNGLDEKFWKTKLRDQGIKSLVQLKHADTKTTSYLENKTNFGWEKNALKACFKREGDNNKDEKKEKQLADTIEKVQERMKGLNDIIDENERRKRIAISFNEALSDKNLHKDLTKWNLSGSEIAKREQLTSLNLIRQISGGRILRGTILCKDMKKCVLPRRKLIDIKQNDVDLMLPSTSEKYTSMEFFKQDQSQAFDHVIQHWGLSAAVSAGKGFGIFSVDIGYVHDESTETTNRNSELSAFTEIKDVVVVQTASFSLADVKHSISDEAMAELKRIDKSQDKKLELCKLFIEAFGFHYFTGTYTFGGIFNRSVQCHSKETLDQSETLKLVKNGIQTSMSGMLETIAGSIAISAEQSSDKKHGELKQEENYTVDKRLAMIGGPPEVDQISIWKLGLVGSNRTWAIIDKHDFKKEWRSVLDLLTDDAKEQFENIHQLETNLVEASIKIGGKN